MKLPSINSAAISRSFHRAALQFKKHSPEIFTAVGIGLGGAAVVAGVKAGTKISTIKQEEIEQIEKCTHLRDTYAKAVEVASPALQELTPYTAEDCELDCLIIRRQTYLKYAKCFAPTVALASASAGFILGGHGIIKKRNTMLSAAYTTLDTGFKSYRKRVAERFGEDAEYKIRHNLNEEIETKTVVDENGKKHKEKVSVLSNPDYAPSDYARVFDETCIGWTKDPIRNMNWLKLQQECANKILKHDGYILLNQVYDMLGMKKTQAGFIVGWIFDPKHPEDHDNEVDFGLYDISKESVVRFINGDQAHVLLDFNVDGVIYDKL